MVFNDKDGHLKVFTYLNGDNSKSQVLDFYDSFVLTPDQDAHCRVPEKKDSLSVPHSASFIDLDGDCMPDLYLTKEHKDAESGLTNYYYEIYIQKMVNGNHKYCLVQTDSIPANNSTS